MIKEYTNRFFIKKMHIKKAFDGLQRKKYACSLIVLVDLKIKEKPF
jgi:hypothetical protein